MSDVTNPFTDPIHAAATAAGDSIRHAFALAVDAVGRADRMPTPLRIQAVADLQRMAEKANRLAAKLEAGS